MTEKDRFKDLEEKFLDMAISFVLVNILGALNLSPLALFTEIVALGLLAAAIVLSWQRPQRALYIFIVGLPLHSLLMAFIFEGTNSIGFVKAIQAWKEILLAVVLLRLVLPAINRWRKDRQLRLTALDVCVAAFVLLCLASVVLPAHAALSGSTSISLIGRLYGFRQLVVPLVAYVIGRLISFDMRDLRWVVGLWGFDALLFSAAAIGERLFWGADIFAAANFGNYLHVFFGFTSFHRYGMTDTFYTGTPDWLPRAFSLTMNPLDLATLLVVTIPVVLSVVGLLRITHSQRRGLMVLLLGTLVMSSAALILSWSRGSLIFGVIVVVIMAIAGGIRWNWPGIGAVVVGGALGLVLFSIIASVIATASIADRPDLGTHGLLTSGAAYNLGTSSPISGVLTHSGDPNNTSTQGHVDSLKQLVTLILHRPVGYGIGTAGQVGIRFNTGVGSESAYFNVGVGLGIQGMLLYFILLGGAIFVCWQVTRSRLSPLWRAAFLGIGVAWVAIVLNGFIAEISLNLFVMFCFWWLTGIAVTKLQQSRVVAVTDATNVLRGYRSARPLRIAIDAQCLQTAKTGVRTYIDEMIAQYKRPNLGHSIVILYGPKRLASTNRVNRIINQAVYFVYLHVALPLRLALGNFDALFSPEYLTPIWAPVARIVTFYDAAFLRRPEDYNPQWLWMFNHITMPAIRRADAVLAPSEDAAKDIIHYGRIDAARLHVVWLAPGSTSITTTDTQQANQAFQKFGVTAGRYVLHVGVLEKRKNLVMLIKAFDLFRRQTAQTNYKLVLVGQPGPRPGIDDFGAVKQAIADLHLEDVVVLTGHLTINERNAFYTRAGIIAIPSLLEGFGLPVLEGFAAGVPVVCSNSSSLPEIAGNAALLFDPTNPAELAACFARLVASPALGDSLVAAGKTQLQRFSWNKTASQTLTVFEKAVVRHYASASDSGVTLSDEVNSYLGDAETVKRTAIPT